MVVGDCAGGALISILLGDGRVGVRRSCNSRLTPTYIDAINPLRRVDKLAHPPNRDND